MLNFICLMLSFCLSLFFHLKSDLVWHVLLQIARKEVTLEERALAAAIPMDAERFSIDFGVDFDEEKEESNMSGQKAGQKVEFVLFA